MFGHPNATLVNNIDIEITLPEEKCAIGKVATIDVGLKPKETVWFRYAFFELIFERKDKRSSGNQPTSRHRYFYRYNVEEVLENTVDSKDFSFNVRIPTHKEPSRDDKFLNITWSLLLKIVFSTSEQNKELLYSEYKIDNVEVI